MVVKSPVKVVVPNVVVPPEVVVRSTALPDTVRSAVVVTAALPVALTTTVRSVAVVTATSFPVTVTTPVKSLAGLLRVISPVVDVTVVVPSTLSGPV